MTESGKIWSQYVIAIASSISAIACGLHFGWPSPTLRLLRLHQLTINISVDDMSNVVSIAPLGYIVSGPFSIFLVDLLGRKVSLLIVAAPQILAWIMIANAKNIFTLYLAKLIAGGAEGAVFTILPLYLCEIAHPSIRGHIGSTFTVFLLFGIFLINCYGPYVSMSNCAYISASVSILFVLSFITMPESPYFLIMKGRIDDARLSLNKLRDADDVDEELNQLTLDVERQMSESGSFKEILSVKANRKAFFMLLGLRTLQQFSGNTAFCYYSDKIFKDVNYLESNYSAVIYNGTNMIFVLVGSFLLDSAGRRPSSGSIICGTLFAWSSPSIPILISNSSEIEPLSLDECSYFGVVACIGLIITAPLVAVLGNFVGNKVMIMFMAIPQTLAWIMVIVAENSWHFYISRFMAGIAEGILFFSIPGYIGEIASPMVRGSWGTAVSILFFVGHLFINIVGSYFNVRTTAYIFVWVPFLTVCFIYFLPESPYYYLRKGSVDKARQSLQKLRWRNDVDEELTLLIANVNQKTGSLKDVFLVRQNRLGLLVGLGTRCFQIFSGFPAIVYFNQLIFNASGSDLSTFQSSVLYSAMQVIIMTLFTFSNDKIGRRRALLFSALGCGLSLMIEGIYFFLFEKLQIDVAGVNWLPLFGLILYVVVFSFGFSTLPTLMLGEVIDPSVKNHSLCIINITYGISLLVSTKLFMVLTSSYGMFAPFWFYSACCFVAIVYVYITVPETKGKTLYEIQEYFNNTKRVTK
ncbi:hypothetical protein FQR65_LT09446 [Abscondita terminalis]|nr:hypothetical protein FQR65_LT09446 [Abscondita terminalis]